ncbi:MAG: FAD:protein FMN transferase [Spirochaetes bacterium]|nr:FAD:protein FMN transferase [Spirochaetota bacterium]
MGTFIAVDVECAHEDCERAFQIVDTTLAEIDAKMSNYHASEITRIAEHAGSADYRQPMSNETQTVLEFAKQVAEKSNGLFDPTIEPLLSAYGFYRRTPGDSALEPSATELARLKPLINFRNLHLKNQSAGLAIAGMRLDLGAIAKGYALDLAAARLALSGFHSFAFDFGGQHLVKNFYRSIQIKHPETGRVVALCELQNGSISVSAQDQRYLLQHDKKIGHIINPHTTPHATQTVLSAVIDRSAMRADAWSTALFNADAAEYLHLARNEGLAGLRIEAEDRIVITKRFEQEQICGIKF